MISIMEITKAEKKENARSVVKFVMDYTGMLPLLEG